MGGPWNIRVVHSPSPQPSPQGEGEPSPVLIRSLRLRVGHAATWLPLLGERVGVRGNVIDAGNQLHFCTLSYPPKASKEHLRAISSPEHVGSCLWHSGHCSSFSTTLRRRL